MDISSRALAEFQSHRASGKVDATKKSCLFRLFESEEYWQIPLAPEQRCNIAFATLNGLYEKARVDMNSGIWQHYILRFRACVRMALHYEKRSTIEDQSSAKVLIAGHEFMFPLSSDPQSYPESVWDLDTILIIFDLLDDVIRVLELAVTLKNRKTYHNKDRATVPSVDLQVHYCKQLLSKKVSLLPESFKSICLSWGFSFPVSAYTLIKNINPIISDENLTKTLDLLKTAYRGFECIVNEIESESRTGGVHRKVS